MSAPHDPPNVVPFPVQVLAVARAAGAPPPSDPYGFAAQAAAMAQAQSSFLLWALECAALHVETAAHHVAFAPPDELTRERLLLMLRTVVGAIRDLKAPPQPATPPDQPAPTTGGAA